MTANRIMVLIFYLISVFLSDQGLVSSQILSRQPQANAVGSSLEGDIRLPKTIRPSHYDLTVKVYLPSYINFTHEKDFTFDATVTMSLEVMDSVEKIVLNMKEIAIDKANSYLTDQSNERIDIEKVVSLENSEKVEIWPKKSVEKGTHVKLTLVYTGLITKKLKGLYQTSYTDADGTEKVAAVTHMEPTYARYLVPCFDEPEFKAKWKVTVVHPKGTKALSNGMEEEETNGDWVTTRFEETPKMSSYLLTIFVSEFDFISGSTANGVTFRIWARKESKEMAQYALNAGIKCLEYYEALYNFPYPLKKEDMVALPDFTVGAMENWGIITYREGSLLYNESLYTPRNRRWVAVIVAHELSHQWFGNLVTMKWWEDLWLNEGFATYVEYLGADHASDQKFRMKEFFIIASLNDALQRDSVSSSHPLSFKIDKAEQIYEAFDPISYDKGGSVIRMIVAIIGEDNFNRGVAHYITKFKYTNADAYDLWSTLDEVIANVAGPNGTLKITDYADQWTKQVNSNFSMGYPLVSVESVNSTHVKLTQERYRRNPRAVDPEQYRNPKYGFKWEVPIWYQKDTEKVEMAWLNREEPLYLTLTNPKQPLVINVDRKGFYRQNHDSKGWEKIAKQLKENHKVYSPETRNAIISDAFAAALIDKVPYETVFDLISYVKDEKKYLPWHETLEGLFEVLEYLDDGPEVGTAKKFMLKLLEPIYKNCSLDRIARDYKNDDLFFEVLLEQAIIEAYCRFGDRSCVGKYKRIFDREVVPKCQGKKAQASRCVSVEPPLREKTYCYGIKMGGAAAYRKMVELYLAESVQLEKDVLRRSLACHKNTTALKEMLFLALDRNSTFVRLQDVTDVFKSISKTVIGRKLLFNFLIANWDRIYDGMMSEHSGIADIISAASEGVRTNQQLEQLKHLKNTGKHANEFSVFDEAIEESEHRVEWIQKHHKRLTEYFKKLE